MRDGTLLSYISPSLNPRTVEPLGKEGAACKKAVRTVRELFNEHSHGAYSSADEAGTYSRFEHCRDPKHEAQKCPNRRWSGWPPKHSSRSRKIVFQPKHPFQYCQPRKQFHDRSRHQSCQLRVSKRHADVCGHVVALGRGRKVRSGRKRMTAMSTTCLKE